MKRKQVLPCVAQCCALSSALRIVRQLADSAYERDLADQPEYEVLLKRLNRYLSCMEAANA